MERDISNLINTLDIEEPLEDIISEECTSVVFECKLSGKSARCNSYRWYKDGKCIESNSKIKLSSDGIWHRLEIAYVDIEDQGVYSILIKTDGAKAFSYANLYLKPITNIYNNHDEVIYMNPSNNCDLVEKQLLSLKLLAGGTIELEAKFKEDAIENYQWYKGDKVVLQNERTIILNDNRTTILSILCAREMDTGIYHVISKTKCGIISSFATVVVIDTDLNTLNNCEITPRIIDPLLDDIETNEGEEIRLMCKAFIDNNTSFEWSKNGKSIDDRINDTNVDIIQEIYNNRYVCLRIVKPIIADVGEYTVIMRNEITGLEDVSSCFLTVNKLPMKKSEPIKLLKPLEPALSSYGCRVLFTCSFDLKDPQYYYVVWYIGHFRVERTNHRFNVFNRGGDFFLFIKQVEPGMCGAVTCELHRSLLNRKSVLNNKTQTYLSIVPRQVLIKERKLLNFTPKLCIYNNTTNRISVPVTIKKGNENELAITDSISTNGLNHAHSEMDGILLISYCKLGDGCFYFDAWCDDENVEQIVIFEKYEENKLKCIVVDWNCKNYNTNEKWFAIEFCQSNNCFIKVGISSLPMFEIKEPHFEQLMRFRIKIISPLSGSSESKVCISPAGKEIIFSTNDSNIKSMDEFNSLYTKTGDLIGCGAFGSVVLVRDQKDEYYAAKILKTRTQKKRDTALREYQIMANLKHSKLVQLIDTFVAKDAFVLVMDYLWGGELFDRIVDEEHIKEVDVVPYVKQICEALQYLHNIKIAHLDLKPENIICLSPNSRQVKIIDFGLARILDNGHETRAIYGTKDYVAPEVLNFEQLTLACDMWSLGVVTYVLLSGVMPFSGDTWVERSANITMANYNYDDSAFKDISDLAKDFVDHLLLLHPDKRLCSSSALNHQWIIQGPPSGTKAGHMKRARENLKSYLANYRARWQRAGNVMIAAHRLRTHVGNQRNATDELERKYND